MHVARSVSTVLLMAGPVVAGGASFDCSKAVTRVEEAICASAALSRLDERLAAAYAAARSSSGRPASVRDEQMRWLRDVRDACRDEACLKSAYEQRLAALTSTTPAQWDTFRDARLGIAFSYPPNRTVTVGCRGSARCVALIGEPMAASDYLVAFEVFEGGLDENAVKNAVFEKEGDAWVAHGRSGQHSVVPLTGPGWQGVEATVDCGISDSLGFHAGAGECLWVVVSNGERAVVVDTQGVVGNDAATLRSIESIQFLE